MTRTVTQLFEQRHGLGIQVLIELDLFRFTFHESDCFNQHSIEKCRIKIIPKPSFVGGDN